MAVTECMLNSGVCDDNIVEALDELEVASTTIKHYTQQISTISWKKNVIHIV